MILVHLNSKGYYITGNGIEITRSCSATLEPLHHIHIVLWYALLEFIGEELFENITILSDTRIIDDMNGDTQPIDDFCRGVQVKIRQELLPRVGTKVFFRKECSSKLDINISNAQESMLKVEVEKRNKAFSDYCDKIRQDLRTIRNNQINRLKEMSLSSTEKWYKNE